MRVEANCDDLIPNLVVFGGTCVGMEKKSHEITLYFS
jgi:hypothetical protein